MKRTKIKILITLVVGVVVLFLIFFMVFNKPESVPNGSASIWTYTPYIELDGNKYLFEDPLGKSNLFFDTSIFPVKIILQKMPFTVIFHKYVLMICILRSAKNG